MAMPLDLVLVRHGESEGNVAHDLSKKGDHSHFTPEFLGRHSSQWRLTERGVRQAHATGAWLRAHVAEAFDHYYVAEYLRAMETAAHLGFAEARWRCEFFLRERDWGVFDVMSFEERRASYGDDLNRRERDAFYWNPPRGESMADLCVRVERVLDTLARECADARVLVCCHGEVMWAFRVRLERMAQERYRELDRSPSPHIKIHNGQVLQYTRRDPESGEATAHLDWMRSVCPWDLARSDNAWHRIERPEYSNADLLAVAERTPRFRHERLVEE